LLTVSALIASGQTAQITYHLNRAMDNGLTKAQTSEMLTQLAFYAGWPNAFSAISVVKGVFEKRSKQKFVTSARGKRNAFPQESDRSHRISREVWTMMFNGPTAPESTQALDNRIT
jgi:hypothetical protein